MWKGFEELFRLGLIAHLPRLAIVQAAGCAPMVHAFHAGASVATPVVPQTLITVLATGDPGFGYTQLYNAVLQTGGTMLAVEDGVAFQAMRHLAARTGLSVEPAAAVAFAGLEHLLLSGAIAPHESVVVNATGRTMPVESHVVGTDFTVDLPLRARATTQAMRALEEQVTTVLVVDDNPNDRRLIRRLLARYKRYRVQEASSGAEALALVHDRLPDLVVADLTMPQMDGLTLIEQLKADARTAHIPVVVVSGASPQGDDQRVLSLLSASVWTKGNFEARALVEHIVATLGDAPLIDAPASGISGAPLVLVVDDNAQVLRLLQKQLAHGGYRFASAHDGRDGLRAAHTHHPDVIVLDVMLPDMDGYAVLRTLRADPTLHHIPVVMHSSLDGLHPGVLSPSDGVFFVPKGDTTQFPLLHTIQQALGGSSPM